MDSNFRNVCSSNSNYKEAENKYWEPSPFAAASYLGVYPSNSKECSITTSENKNREMDTCEYGDKEKEEEEEERGNDEGGEDTEYGTDSTDSQDGVAAGFYPSLQIEINTEGEPQVSFLQESSDNSEQGLFVPQNTFVGEAPMVFHNHLPMFSRPSRSSTSSSSSSSSSSSFSFSSFSSSLNDENTQTLLKKSNMSYKKCMQYLKDRKN